MVDQLGKMADYKKEVDVMSYVVWFLNARQNFDSDCCIASCCMWMSNLPGKY